MGLIDFVKDAGERIFGKDKEEAPAAPTESPAVFDARKGRALEDTVTTNGPVTNGPASSENGLHEAAVADAATPGGAAARREAPAALWGHAATPHHPAGGLRGDFPPHSPCGPRPGPRHC